MSSDIKVDEKLLQRFGKTLMVVLCANMTLYGTFSLLDKMCRTFSLTKFELLGMELLKWIKVKICLWSAAGLKWFKMLCCGPRRKHSMRKDWWGWIWSRFQATASTMFEQEQSLMNYICEGDRSSIYGSFCLRRVVGGPVWHFMTLCDSTIFYLRHISKSFQV